MHPDVPGGTWECPGAGSDPDQVEVGGSCVLRCDNGTFGGMISCVLGGIWDETSLFGCQ